MNKWIEAMCECFFYFCVFLTKNYQSETALCISDGKKKQKNTNIKLYDKS